MVFNHAGFLTKFAQCSGFGLLAFVNPALRHLPCIGIETVGRVQPLADEHLTFAVGEHDTGAGAVREFAVILHRLASSVFHAAIILSTSCWAEGTALRILMKPWTFPGISMKCVFTPWRIRSAA